MKGWKELEYEVVRDAADVSTCFRTPELEYQLARRTPSFAVTWKTLTHLGHTLEIPSSLLPPRPFRMTNTICFALLLLRSFGTWASLENVTFNTR